MVTKINIILPFQTNKDIIQMLINEARWKITSDTGRFEGEERNTDVNKMLDKNINNAGFSHVTFDRKFNLHIDTPFNLYGDIIFYTIKNKLKTIKTLHIYTFDMNILLKYMYKYNVAVFHINI